VSPSFLYRVPLFEPDARERCNRLSIHNRLKGKKRECGIALHPQQRMKQRIKDEQEETDCDATLRGRSLVPVFIDAQPPDLRFQSLARYSEFRGCSAGSAYSPMAISESSFDHLNFTIGQCRKAFVSR